MAKRKRIKVGEFGPKVFTSGCALLDCALGGGWADGRIINIVGDNSTGKTLLIIEAAANFVAQYPHSTVYLAEAEAAFDMEYAGTLGLPLGNVEVIENCLTVEEVFTEMLKAIDREGDSPALFMLDSLDAVSSNAEQARKIDETNTYGAEKARKMSELFRRLVKKLKGSNTTVIIVSQVREKIGVAFGEKYSRSGGKALDFYSSQIVWLSHLGYLQKERSGEKRAYGIRVKAKVKKNKVGVPFREAEFPIHFNFGVEDVDAAMNWLIKVSHTAEIGMSKEATKSYISKTLPTLGSKDYRMMRKKTSRVVRRVWAEIEEKFRPKRSKYGEPK